MKEGFRQSMAWLHTWTGLLFGWLCFAIFATGTCAYFREEITQYMQPEVASIGDKNNAIDGAARYLNTVAPDAVTWYITPPSSRAASTDIFWEPAEKPGQKPAKRGETSASLDMQGNKVEARETRGGDFLYRFHFDLHYLPVLWARYLVGIAAMFMLIAILSGVVTHKKIFVDFFMLRFGKGQRSWLDAHNVTAVLALPFHLMITFTGLITLAIMYMPWGVAANYVETDTFYEAVFPQAAQVERSGIAAPLTPLAPIFAKATLYWDGAKAGTAQISNPGDSTAKITISKAPESGIGARTGSLVFNGVTGELDQPGLAAGPAMQTQGAMIQIHAGRFAQMPLRWLYFLSGVGGTVMIGTGLVLWTVKRRSKLPDPTRPHFGFKLVERINIAVVAGVPAGLAAFFLANRLLPLGLEKRAQWEVHCMFIAWGAILLWGLLRPTKRAWVEGLSFAAILYALVPIATAVTTERNFIVSVMNGDWIYIGFDTTMVVAALLLGWTARKALYHQPKVKPARKARGAAETEVVLA